MFTNILDILMENKGINKHILSKESGIPYTTVDGFYKKGTANIKLSTLKKISVYFNVSLDVLAENNLSTENDALETELNVASVETNEENKLLLNFRELSLEGRERLIFYLNDLVASGNYKNIKASNVVSIPLPLMDEVFDEELSEDLFVDIILFDTPVSAGQGMLLSDDVSNINISVNTKMSPQARMADFALKISGDSMQPNFYDGDIVFIKMQQTIENGQIGIFVYDGESYIKKYVLEDDGAYLVSLNEKYDPIKLDRNLVCVVCGIVL